MYHPTTQMNTDRGEIHRRRIGGACVFSDATRRRRLFVANMLPHIALVLGVFSPSVARAVVAILVERRLQLRELVGQIDRRVWTDRRAGARGVGGCES